MLDRSGSMHGSPLAQSQNALQSALRMLTPRVSASDVFHVSCCLISLIVVWCVVAASVGLFYRVCVRQWNALVIKHCQRDARAAPSRSKQHQLRLQLGCQRASERHHRHPDSLPDGIGAVDASPFSWKPSTVPAQWSLQSTNTRSMRVLPLCICTPLSLAHFPNDNIFAYSYA